MMVSLPVISIPFTIAFLSAVTSTVFGDVSFPKCCDKNQYLTVKDSNFVCKLNENKRLQIFSENYDFLSGNGEGDCIDFDNVKFYVYKIKDSKIISRDNLNETYYPKCCPLGMIYNPDDRSCIIKPTPNENWINGTLIKVGLPHCKLITDKIISNASDFLNEVLGRDEASYCVDQTEDNNFVIRECKESTLCDTRRCIRKCCPDGQSFVGGGNCLDTHVHGFNIQNASFVRYVENPNDHFEVLYNTVCPAVHLLGQNKVSYSITKDGVWRYYLNYSKSFVEELYDHPRSYCIEHAQKGTLSDYLLFECINKSGPVAAKFGWTFWSKILSCVLLVATVIIYIIMGEVRNPFGKILINYCTAMFCLLVILLVTHTHLLIKSRLECKLRSYFLILFNLALYAWLNIMSLDIWWTFGSPKRTICHNQRMKELRKMLLYSLYGWGFPICHTLIILMFDVTHVLPEQIQPYVGIYFCYLELRNYARHFFILTPLLIIQIVNTVLFIKTATYCIRVKKEISKMNDTTRGKKETSRIIQNKDRLGLIVKLAVIMGVTYIFELTSAFFDMKTTQYEYLEVVMDNIVCLQGVYIFIIFICKRKTIDFFKHKRYMAKERRNSCSTSFTSQVHNNTNNGSIQLKNEKL